LFVSDQHVQQEYRLWKEGISKNNTVQIKMEQGMYDFMEGDIG